MQQQPPDDPGAAEATKPMMLDDSIKNDCFSCRAIGTVVPLGCSAYLAVALKDIPRGNILHRGMVVAFAAGFATMGCVRAMI